MNRGITVASALYELNLSRKVNSVSQHENLQIVAFGNLNYLNTNVATVTDEKYANSAVETSIYTDTNKQRSIESYDMDLKSACVLGWCIEILQASFLVADDIMDASSTRRGALCRYKCANVGLIAVNDAFILESSVYQLLKMQFGNDACYPYLLELFHETSYQTELGQLMDLITSPTDAVDFKRFSMETYKYIVEYKTAYYSFYLPVALAMTFAGGYSQESFEEAKTVLLALGEYFQIQVNFNVNKDDFLDCYGSPEVIGKIGTDIQDNKCSWLIVQAILVANPEQLDQLSVLNIFNQVFVRKKGRRKHSDCQEYIQKA